MSVTQSYKDWTKTLSPLHQKLLYTQTEYKGANFNQYIKTNPSEFDKNKEDIIAQRLKYLDKRLAVIGNCWQNLYPQELVSYQNWWKKIQAA